MADENGDEKKAPEEKKAPKVKLKPGDVLLEDGDTFRPHTYDKDATEPIRERRITIGGKNYEHVSDDPETGTWRYRRM